MRELIERVDGFNYGYRMRCRCGGIVAVSAQTYDREQSIEARVPCEHCRGQVHFGPAVAVVRDENDPALDNEAIESLAWYHTSTWADWPSPQHDIALAASYRENADRMRGLGIRDIDGAIRRATSRALHLGTYETAIENMLRRMRNQADESSQFYLYRVAVRVEPERINEGYRDENAEEAAQLGLDELETAGLDCVRYLNVHEATGSLSLAVRPECIVATQRLAIPVDELAATPSAALAAQLCHLEAQQMELDQERAGLPKLTQMELIGMRIGRQPDPDNLARRVEEVEHLGYALWADVERTLTDAYLPEVSPVVAGDVRGAVSAWRRKGEVDSIAGYAERFAVMSTLLTRSTDVVERLSQQPWRGLRSD